MYPPALPLILCCSVAGWANEQIGGVSYIQFVRGLVDRVQHAWPAVLSALQRIRREGSGALPR